MWRLNGIYVDNMGGIPHVTEDWICIRAAPTHDEDEGPGGGNDDDKGGDDDGQNMALMLPVDPPRPEPEFHLPVHEPAAPAPAAPPAAAATGHGATPPTPPVLTAASPALIGGVAATTDGDQGPPAAFPGVAATTDGDEGPPALIEGVAATTGGDEGRAKRSRPQARHGDWTPTESESDGETLPPAKR